MLGVLTDAMLYLQLHVGDPGVNGTTNVAALSARAPITFGDPSGRQVSNTADVTWFAPGADETITHCSIWTSDGDFWWGGALEPNYDVITGVNLTIPAGAVVGALP